MSQEQDIKQVCKIMSKNDPFWKDFGYILSQKYIFIESEKIQSHFLKMTEYNINTVKTHKELKILKQSQL